MKRIFTIPTLIIAAALGPVRPVRRPPMCRETLRSTRSPPVIEAPTQDWSITAYEITVARTAERVRGQFDQARFRHRLARRALGRPLRAGREDLRRRAGRR